MITKFYIICLDDSNDTSKETTGKKECRIQ